MGSSTPSSVTTVDVKDYSASKAIQNIILALNPVLQQAIVSGTLVTALQVQAMTPYSVVHSLNRPAKGWFVTRTVGPTVISLNYVEGIGNSDFNQITLVPSGSGLIDLWVF